MYNNYCCSFTSAYTYLLTATESLICARLTCVVQTSTFTIVSFIILTKTGWQGWAAKFILNNNCVNISVHSYAHSLWSRLWWPIVLASSTDSQHSQKHLQQVFTISLFACSSYLMTHSWARAISLLLCNDIQNVWSECMQTTFYPTVVFVPCVYKRCAKGGRVGSHLAPLPKLTCSKSAHLGSHSCTPEE